MKSSDCVYLLLSLRLRFSKIFFSRRLKTKLELKVSEVDSASLFENSQFNSNSTETLIFCNDNNSVDNMQLSSPVVQKKKS